MDNFKTDKKLYFYISSAHDLKISLYVIYSINIIKFYNLKIYSDLDTRVISELIASKGIDSLNCLDGMYSLLIYDKIINELHNKEKRTIS